ncbi:MAG: PilT/PilU family type 4a pilus ATPase [Candidatus Riflebacteria bacterium]|nr:PilT/PilU family type 4a pilus ATPase [Candidatus Riflebacteria bacterium]
MSKLLQPLIEEALKVGAYDLHLKSAFSPIVRVANEIRRLDLPAFSPKEMEQLVVSLLDENQRKQFKARGQIDCSFTIPGIIRVRANIFFQRNSLAISCRLVPPTPPDMATLGFAQEVTDTLSKINNGMVLITGATNSGKSTTAASLIDLIARTHALHIITIEDPVEYVFPRYPKTIISQRQIGDDTVDFQTGLTSALRQDPDVVLIGELRDLETVETCLKAAETGHMVVATLHTSNAVQSITRMINIFPSHQRDNIRFMISSSLKCVLSQVLLPSYDHKKRVLAYEMLPMLPSVSNLIRQRKIHEINSVMRLGQRSGCIPMNTIVKDLLKRKLVRHEDVPPEMLEEK